MTEVENKDLLKAINDIRYGVVSGVSRKNGLRVSKKAREKIESGASIDDSIKYVFAEAKPLRRTLIRPKKQTRINTVYRSIVCSIII